ncbi:uncharacterized protein GGS22DRAFT_50116 [Annulohypoxylon maeteangense]|uniref:uncharacterized protein n=1 Tax=Annulohypoxylon maeteangense TaxID=1927788 RepID=UPI0020084D46|nr:uncharacterized protein GGS22DRAFT_50116 [Annulohypoxylon maeteangense]KAI0882305.1 hypothetical protein GGS22DRAFT_50116 [Annulohypoxylon maeteangense]
MALPLHIPHCICTLAYSLHPPQLEKPVRVQIEGPLVSTQKLLPEVPWHVDVRNPIFPQPAGLDLARLAYRAIYGHDADISVENDMIVRDEYLGWVHEKNEIDYYGVTFDHLVPDDDYFPEVLQINILEMDEDEGEYANTYLPFIVDPAEYIGKKILAVPRCCQKRKGSTDRPRVNGSVTQKDLVRQGFDREMMMSLLVAHGVFSTKILEKRFDKVPQPRIGLAPKEKE